MFNEEIIIFHLKGILKTLCYDKRQAKGLIHIIVTFRAEKCLCTFLSWTKHPFHIWGVWNTAQKNNFVAVFYKEWLESLNSPERKYLPTQVNHFVHDFWKKYHEVNVSSNCSAGHAPIVLNKAYKNNCVPEFPIFSALKLPSYGLVPSIYLQKTGISKHFWQKLGSCFRQLLLKYLLNKSWTWIELDVDSAYEVCIHWSFQNFTADSKNTMQFMQMINLIVC